MSVWIWAFVGLGIAFCLAAILVLVTVTVKTCYRFLVDFGWFWIRFVLCEISWERMEPAFVLAWNQIWPWILQASTSHRHWFLLCGLLSGLVAMIWYLIHAFRRRKPATTTATVSNTASSSNRCQRCQGWTVHIAREMIWIMQFVICKLLWVNYVPGFRERLSQTWQASQLLIQQLSPVIDANHTMSQLFATAVT